MQAHPSLLVFGDLLKLTGLLGLPAQPGLRAIGLLGVLLASAQSVLQTTLLLLQLHRLDRQPMLPDPGQQDTHHQPRQAAPPAVKHPLLPSQDRVIQ
jgi:hypothetical protein